MLKSLRIIVFASLFLVNPVSAEQFNWHGFVAQGLIHAQDSNYVEDDGSISIKLTEVGLNGSYRINNTLRVAGQAVYLNGGNRYPEGTRVDYLFADWQAVDYPEWQLNVFLGRIKNYHWLYSSTRDVPHTRPTIILPQSFYFDAFRDVALGIDGVGLASRSITDFGEWELNWSYGASPISTEQKNNLLSSFSTGELKQDYVQQLDLMWQSPDQMLKLGAGLLDSEFNYHRGEMDLFIDGDAKVQRFMLRASYDSEHWQLAMEYLRERSIYSNLIASMFLDDSTAEGGFIQGLYFVTPSITLTARLDILDADRHDRSGRERTALSGNTIPPYFGFQDQFTLGASWQFAGNWKIQSEFHRVKGTARLPSIFVPNIQQNDSKYWNIWAIQLMHWF